MTENYKEHPPIETPINGRDGLWTFDRVEERLIEAMDLWRRSPDRERSWQHVKASWPEIMRHGWRVDVDGEFDERAAVEEPRRTNPSRDQIRQMIEASEWLLLAPERDRRLVAAVLGYHVRHVKKIPWLRIWDRLGRGEPGPEGLRKRYSRAVTAIVQQLGGRGVSALAPVPATRRCDPCDGTGRVEGLALQTSVRMVICGDCGGKGRVEV